MAKLLWQPSEDKVKSSNLYAFMTGINGQYNTDFSEYTELHRWSIENIPEFWAAMSQYADIIATQPYEQVLNDPKKITGSLS